MVARRHGHEADGPPLSGPAQISPAEQFFSDARQACRALRLASLRVLRQLVLEAVSVQQHINRVKTSVFSPGLFVAAKRQPRANRITPGRQRNTRRNTLNADAAMEAGIRGIA
jgi:hypothetical protein